MRHTSLLRLTIGFAAFACAPAYALNGCNFSGVPVTAGNATVTASGISYVNPCRHLAVGATITFTMNFGLHPFAGGEYDKGNAFPAKTGPFVDGFSGPGNSVTFTLTEAGEFPYYCLNHAFAGMVGSVKVSDPNVVFGNGFEGDSN